MIDPDYFDILIPKLQSQALDVMDPLGAAQALATIALVQQQAERNQLLRDSEALHRRGVEGAEQHTALLKEAMAPKSEIQTDPARIIIDITDLPGWVRESICSLIDAIRRQGTAVK